MLSNSTNNTEIQTLIDNLADIKKSAQVIIETLEKEVMYNQFVFRTVAHLLTDSLIFVEYDHVKIANQSAATLLGIPLLELSGKPIAEVFPDISDPAFLNQKEWKYTDPISEIPKYLDVSVSKIAETVSEAFPVDPDVKSSSKLKNSYVILARDVTDRKTQEFKVLDLASFQSHIIEYIPLPMFYTNLEGGNLRGSKSFFEMFETTQKDLVYDSVTTLFSAEVANSFKPRDTYGLDPEAIEILVTVNGVKKNLLVLKSIFKDSEDRILGHIATVTEIPFFPSEGSTEYSLVSMLTNSTQPMAVTVMPDSKIMLLNKAFTDHYGHGNEIIGKSIFEYVPKLDASYNSELRLNLREMLLEGKTWIGKGTIVRSDKTVKTDRIKIIPVMKNSLKNLSYCIFLRLGDKEE